MRLRICHLYPDLLNLYGDRGNVLIIRRRAAWRGVEVELDQISLQDRVRFTDYDLVFLGGGADQDQGLVSRDMERKGPLLVEAAEEGVVILSICGGFQLLGRYYRAQDGGVLPGVGLFDVYTEAGRRRLKGNILIETEADLREEMERCSPGALSTLVGFENHSGRTFLGDGARPLGRVLKGNGNNGEDRAEGARYKNAFGTYLHGPFLSKNPHFADLLIARALARRHGEVSLAPLDDSLEWHAHRVVKERLQKGCRRPL
ncbi:MAG TPA: glutamine amidotransferase [Syntrophomonadaceae bacterium]|nr:glutamine amidotransferase [Syntrophomonadaceae bacterium]